MASLLMCVAFAEIDDGTEDCAEIFVLFESVRLFVL